MKGSEPPEPLLHLILVKYYLSFQWTQTCHFFEKCATIWLIAVSTELPIQILTALYHIPYWWEIHVLYLTYNSHSPSKMLYMISWIVHREPLLALRLHWAEKIAFSPWSAVAVWWELCLRAASVHLWGLIKPPEWLLSGGKLSGIRC